MKTLFRVVKLLKEGVGERERQQQPQQNNKKRKNLHRLLTHSSLTR